MNIECSYACMHAPYTYTCMCAHTCTPPHSPALANNNRSIHLSRQNSVKRWGMQGAGRGMRETEFSCSYSVFWVKHGAKVQTYKKKTRGSVRSQDLSPFAPSSHLPSLVLYYVHGTWLFLQESSLEIKALRETRHWQTDRLSFQEIWPDIWRRQVCKD